MKSKGEKGRYRHLNAEFQRIARRDKKAFFSDQCKEIKEKNRMGKAKDLFKKIRDTKGIFRAKMGSIKDRNCLDLTVRLLSRVRLFVTPMNCSTPGLPVYHQLPEFTQTHVHRVSDAILCHPLLFLPPIPLSIRVFSNESTLRMRLPKL